MLILYIWFYSFIVAVISCIQDGLKVNSTSYLVQLQTLNGKELLVFKLAKFPDLWLRIIIKYIGIVFEAKASNLWLHAFFPY